MPSNPLFTGVELRALVGVAWKSRMNSRSRMTRSPPNCRMHCHVRRTSWNSCRRFGSDRRGWRALTQVNNTAVGLWYIGAALLFMVLGGILALIMRAAARGAGERSRRSRFVQPAVHDARLGDDVFVRRAGHRSDRHSAVACDARCARSAVSAFVRVCVLGVFRRRPRVLHDDILRSGARWRLVHVSAAHELRVLAGIAHGFLVARHRLHRDLCDRRRDRDRRGHSAHATARHDARQDADLSVGDADRRRDDHLRLSAGDSRDGIARARARISLAVFHRGAGRRSACFGSTCSGCSVIPTSTSFFCPPRDSCR